LIIYPVIGYFAGHAYPSSPGLACPARQLFSPLGCSCGLTGNAPLFILIIPLLWSVIGFFAAFSLGVREDIGLLISGLAGRHFDIYQEQKKQAL
jgi:hypothetical protein